MLISVKIVDLLQTTTVIFKCECRWHQTVKDVKDLLYKHTSIPPSKISLFHLHSPTQLRNTICLHYLVPHSGNNGGTDSTVVLRFISTQSATSQDFILQPISDTQSDSDAQLLLDKIRKGFLANKQPIKTELLDCTGGVYFLRNGCGNRQVC
jgi:hypothetical protein